MFEKIAIIDYNRPIKKRHQFGGHYYIPSHVPFRDDGWSTYETQHSDETGDRFRLRISAANNHLQNYPNLRRIDFYRPGIDSEDEYTPVVFRLPKSRGFLAGYTLGHGMLCCLSAILYDDAEEAAYAAHQEAEHYADVNAQEYDDDFDQDEEGEE
jgi:hypothetical protein